MQLFSWSKEPTGAEIAASGDDFCKADKKEKQMTIRYLEHVIDCQNGKLSRQKWPEKGTCLEFEKVHALRSQPLIIYMDFETSNQSLREVILTIPPFFQYQNEKHLFYSYATSAPNYTSSQGESIEQKSWNNANRRVTFKFLEVNAVTPVFSRCLRPCTTWVVMVRAHMTNCNTRAMV